MRLFFGGDVALRVSVTLEKQTKMSTVLATTDFIATKILFLRGEKVLLDTDLALLYGVETRVLK